MTQSPQPSRVTAMRDILRRAKIGENGKLIAITGSGSNSVTRRTVSVSMDPVAPVIITQRPWRTPRHRVESAVTAALPSISAMVTLRRGCETAAPWSKSPRLGRKKIRAGVCFTISVFRLTSVNDADGIATTTASLRRCVTTEAVRFVVPSTGTSSGRMAAFGWPSSRKPTGRKLQLGLRDKFRTRYCPPTPAPEINVRSRRCVTRGSG